MVGYHRTDEQTKPTRFAFFADSDVLPFGETKIPVTENVSPTFASWGSGKERTWTRRGENPGCVLSSSAPKTSYSDKETWENSKNSETSGGNRTNRVCLSWPVTDTKSPRPQSSRAPTSRSGPPLESETLSIAWLSSASDETRRSRSNNFADSEIACFESKGYT